MDLIPIIRTITPEAIGAAARFLLNEPLRGDAFTLIKEGLTQNIPNMTLRHISINLLVSAAVRNVDVLSEIERARIDEKEAAKSQPELF